MKRRILLAYQLLTGLSDATTGLLLIFAPALTLRLMRLHEISGALPFLSFAGAFVLSVGIACLYGAFLATRADFVAKLEVVWLLTAITRALVAVFIVSKIASGSFEVRWATVAVSDGALALIQWIGLWKGWLADAAG
jgi:hypothetical protein